MCVAPCRCVKGNAERYCASLGRFHTKGKSKVGKVFTCTGLLELEDIDDGRTFKFKSPPMPLWSLKVGRNVKVVIVDSQSKLSKGSSGGYCQIVGQIDFLKDHGVSMYVQCPTQE